MTEEQKQEVERLRRLGWGYRTIATVLNVTRDQVRCYCRKIGLDGYRHGKITEKPEPPVIRGDGIITCKNCGAFLEQPIVGRKRKFCCEQCRREWDIHNLVSKIYGHKCIYCGKIFKSKASRQNYCNRECYKRDRFCREEDAEKIGLYLKEGKRPEVVPGWVIKLLVDEVEQEKK